MPYQPKDGDGVIFPKPRKNHPKAPDMEGTLLLCCSACKHRASHDVSAWEKQGNGPKPFYTLRVQEKGSWRKQPQTDPQKTTTIPPRPAPQPAQPVRGAFPEEDLPRQGTLPTRTDTIGGKPWPPPQQKPTKTYDDDVPF